MSIIHSLICTAAEPASILYIVTGAVCFACAGIRRTVSASGKTPGKSSIPMLFCRRTSRTMLETLDLL